MDSSNSDKVFQLFGTILEKESTDLVKKKGLAYRLWQALSGAIVALFFRFRRALTFMLYRYIMVGGNLVRRDIRKLMNRVTPASTAAVKVRPVDALRPPELHHFILD